MERDGFGIHFLMQIWQTTALHGNGLLDAVLTRLPYFRIFNPIIQGEKFDPNGEYVKKYVPELSNIPNKFIHKPWEASPEILSDSGVELGENYPHPIVDLKQSRDHALSEFKNSLGEDD